MSKINIKVGEMYFVRVKVTELMDDKIITRTVSDKGSPLNESHTIFFDDEVLAFSHVPYSAPIEFFKTTEIPAAAPKYAPCRKFKAGDKVSPCFMFDRPPVAYYISDVSGHFTPEDGVYEVDKDELPDSTVLVKYKGKTISMLAYHLELMTPVEELGTYVVRHNEVHSAWSIYGPFNLSAVNYFYGERYPYTKETAKEAAEAERDRLNAEHRKELEK